MIAILDYDAGNLTSVLRAVTHLGYPCRVTNDPDAIRDADRIIFPGVGAAGSAMESLRRLGLDAAIRHACAEGKPLLGICLGTQIIMGYSQENDAPCLGLIDGTVRAFPPELKSGMSGRLKIPHMGWNRLDLLKDHPVLSGTTAEDEFYFVHSFYPEPVNPEHVLATTCYGISFASVVGCRNLVATQFHLEKSGRPGLRMLQNFCEWKP